MPLDINGYRITSTVAENIKTPKLIRTGLSIYLDANDSESYPGSGTTWYDISGNGNNFVISGATFNSPDNYFLVGGSYGVIYSSGNVLTGRDFTLSGWFRMQDYTANHVLFSDYDDSSPRDGYILYAMDESTYSKKVRLDGRPSTTTTNYQVFCDTLDATPPYTYPINEWIYFTATRDTTSSSHGLYTVYINGNFIIQNRNNTNLTATTNDRMWIGRIESLIRGSFHIAEAHLYTRALTHSEVLKNYNATKTRYQ